MIGNIPFSAACLCLVNFASVAIGSTCPGLCTRQHWGQRGDDGSPKQANTPETTEALGAVSRWAVPSDAGQGVCVSVWALCPLSFPLFWMEARIDAGFIFTGRTPSLCHEIAVCVTLCINTDAAPDKFLGVFFFLYTYTVFPLPLHAAVHSIHFNEKAEDVGWRAVREFGY